MKFVRIEVDGGLQHHYIRAKQWGHPAGRIESGETPRQAAHRELTERTGYAADQLQLLRKEGDTHVYRAGKVTKVGPPQTEVRWKQFSVSRKLYDKVIEFSTVPRASLNAPLREGVMKNPFYRKPSLKHGFGVQNVMDILNPKYKKKSIPIKDVISSQYGVEKQRVEEFKKNPAIRPEPPVVRKLASGKYFIHDGNHYLVAMRKLGRKRAIANVIQATVRPLKNFSAARNLFNKVIEFKTLYIPGEKDEPPETLPNLKGVVDYNVQRHAAKRAGLHRDVRLGTRRHGLLSWATRKDLPAEGGHIAVHPQPVHSHRYLGWTGDIPEGRYGAGKVSTEHIGKALITKSTSTEVHATLADQKAHHRLALIKTAKGWLMTRGKHPQPPSEASKPSYKSVEPEKAHETLRSLPEGSVVQPKVDGALVYVTTKGNRPEIFSHRKGKQSGRNIIHTERFFHGRPTTNIPKEHQRTLIGELYGTRRGKAIEPQELGGILNTHLGESIQKQKTRGVKLKIMPFDYANGKGESYPERLAKVKETLKHLPGKLFHPPEEAHTPGAARRLFDKIKSGLHHQTKEGVIIHPPHGKMIKIKNTSEDNVKITGTYPGEGKFKGSHGGFTYKGGRVGTGFTDETRRRLHEYVGRVARIRHQGRFKSGAHRAPSFIGVDENK